MESNTHQESGERKKFAETHQFIQYLKGRLVDYVDPVTKERWTGHVAMYYKDTGRIRIDWDNGATTYHDFTVDSRWIFKTVKKGDGDGKKFT